MQSSIEQSADELARFRAYFPVASWVVRNVWLLLPVFAAVALFASLCSVHYGLSIMCLWMGIVCFWVDRKHLNYCLVTPLQPMAVVLVTSLGAGISMVVFDSPEKYQFGYLSMQLAGLLGFPLFMAAYYLVTKNVPGFVFPRFGAEGNSVLTRPLVAVGWLCLLHELGKVVAGVVSGSMDKGYGGDFLVDTPFGWWTIFNVFQRLQTLGYILVPLIWRESRMLGRIAVAGVVGFILFLHFVAASRGQVFAPMFIFLIGSFMFLDSRRIKYELLLLVGVAGLAPFLTIMANYRNTEAFREADIRDIGKKIGTFKEGLARKQEMEQTSGEKYSEAGRAFIGVADFLVYEMTPGSVPHEGFGRMDEMPWIFVPYILSQGNRPIPHDGYLIVGQYTGQMLERTSIGISWPAELYRRWGWFGIPIGLFLYGLFYGVVFRYVYLLYLNRNALWGFIVCGLLFHFFIAWFWHTVLTNFWFWFYDIPKHLLLLGTMYFVIRMAFGIDKSVGALSLMGLGAPPPVAPVARQGFLRTALDRQAMRLSAFASRPGRIGFRNPRA